MAASIASILGEKHMQHGIAGKGGSISLKASPNLSSIRKIIRRENHNPCVRLDQCPAEFKRSFVSEKLSAIKMPQIISKIQISKAQTHFSRLYIKQSGKCHYCQKTTTKKEWSIDHVIPLSRGGSNAFSNKVGACKTCNNAKGCLTKNEFLSLSSKERKKLIAEWQSKLNPQSSDDLQNTFSVTPNLCG